MLVETTGGTHEKTHADGRAGRADGCVAGIRPGGRSTDRDPDRGRDEQGVRHASRVPRQSRQGRGGRGQLQGIARGGGTEQGGPVRRQHDPGDGALLRFDRNAERAGRVSGWPFPTAWRSSSICRMAATPTWCSTRSSSSRCPPAPISATCCLRVAASPPDAAKPTKFEQFVASHPTVPAAFASACHAGQLRRGRVLRHRCVRVRQQGRREAGGALSDDARAHRSSGGAPTRRNERRTF